MVSSSFSFSPMLNTGIRIFVMVTLEVPKVMEYSRFFSKSSSTASNSVICFAFGISPISTFFRSRNVLASPAALPKAFCPPRALVSATAAIFPFPWLGVNSHTNLYPLSSFLLSVWFRLPLATLEPELTLLEA